MHPLRDAFRLPLVMVRYRELLSAFVRRELRARVEGSLLGRIWPVVHPAVIFGIYHLVFARLLKIEFQDVLAPHGPEGVGWRSTFYLITGILPWTVLAESLARGSGVVLENANLIKKIAFPSELLPIYTVVVNHVYFLIGYSLLLLLEGIVNGGLPGALVWLPALLLVQFVFISGLAMFLSAANIFVRDVAQLVPVAVTFWMFTTPVFYDLGAVQLNLEHAQAAAQSALAALPPGAPELPGAQEVLDAATDAVSDMAAVNAVMRWNPMATLLDLHRSIFTYGQVPFDPGRLLRLGLVGLFVQLLAYAFFLRSKGRFADEV